MNIKLQLLKGHISDLLERRLGDLEIDVTEIPDSISINMLAEIQNILSNENYSDFDVVEKIVCVFEKNGIDFGSRHNFWCKIIFNTSPPVFKSIDIAVAVWYNKADIVVTKSNKTEGIEAFWIFSEFLPKIVVKLYLYFKGE